MFRKVTRLLICTAKFFKVNIYGQINFPWEMPGLSASCIIVLNWVHCRYMLEHPPGSQDPMNPKCATIVEKWEIMTLEDFRSGVYIFRKITALPS